MQFDEDEKKILTILLTDKNTLISDNISEYIAGKTGISKSHVDYELSIFVSNGLAHWEPSDTGRDLVVDETADYELNILIENKRKNILDKVQKWVWPIVTAAIGGYLSYLLSH